LKSDHWGKVSVGLQSQASDNTAILVDGSGSLIPANFVQFDYGLFQFRNATTGALTGITLSSVLGCTDCNGVPLNAVRYDSPTFAGFSVSASWGEDDFWDVAARYAGEFSGFKLAVAAAYSESVDPGVQGVGLTAPPIANPIAAVVDETQFFQIGAYLQHVPTGLFVYGAYGNFDGDVVNTNRAFREHEFWYVKAGIRQKWNHLGNVVLYGEYEESDDGFCSVVATTGAGSACSSDFELWGLGAVQEVDAAAMSIWLKYRHIEGEVTGTGIYNLADQFEDFDYVSFGALINF
jgi:predicted porin